MRTLLPVLLIIAVTGCATPEQRATQIQREVDEMITVYGPGCDKLGFITGTDAWRECILRLDARDTLRYNYRIAPTTTACVGHRGFFQCSIF